MATEPTAATGFLTLRRLIGGLLIIAAIAAFGQAVVDLPAADAHQAEQRYGMPADDARALAEQILSDPRFTPQTNETIFTRLRRAIEDYLQRLFVWLRDATQRAGESVPGGMATIWAIILAVVVGGSAFAAAHFSRRRARAIEEHERGVRSRALGIDPSQLEAEATQAAAAGHFGEAVRLRYQAGLLRLGERGVIEYQPSLTSGEVASRIRSASFDEVAGTFDSIAYGEAGAEPVDAERSSAAWKRILGGSD